MSLTFKRMEEVAESAVWLGRQSSGPSVRSEHLAIRLGWYMKAEEILEVKEKGPQHDEFTAAFFRLMDALKHEEIFKEYKVYVPWWAYPI